MTKERDLNMCVCSIVGFVYISSFIFLYACIEALVLGKYIKCLISLADITGTQDEV